MLRAKRVYQNTENGELLILMTEIREYKTDESFWICLRVPHSSVRQKTVLVSEKALLTSTFIDVTEQIEDKTNPELLEGKKEGN